jgi:hypothetical protein
MFRILQSAMHGSRPHLVRSALIDRPESPTGTV